MLEVDMHMGQRREPRSGSPWGCLSWIATTLGVMALVAVVIWALNPGMDPEEAARQGVVWGGSLVLSLCLLPGLVLAGLVGAAAVLLRRAARRPPQRPSRREDGVIDVD